MRKYRELKRLAWANATALVREADLDQLFGDIDEEEEEAATKAQNEVALHLEKRAAQGKGANDGS